MWQKDPPQNGRERGGGAGGTLLSQASWGAGKTQELQAIRNPGHHSGGSPSGATWFLVFLH